MKTFLILAIAGFFSIGQLAAGDVVTAGTIRSFSKDGTLELLPQDRAKTTLIFRDIQKVPIYYSSGGRAPTWELQTGRKATIHYRNAGKVWRVAKVSLAAPAPPPPPTGPGIASLWLPSGERHALRSKALRDRDLTTQPGSKATIDRDITTKPSGRANFDRDITTHADRR